MTMTEWRYSICYGPDGEENYAFVMDDKGQLVGNLRIHHAMAVVEGMNAAALPVPAGAVTDEMAEASFRCIRRVVIDNDTNLRRLARQSLEAALASRPAVEATAGAPTQEEILAEADGGGGDEMALSPSPSPAGDEVQGMDALTAALVVLARYNVPPDVQELLVQGNPMRDIRPGALAAALTQLSEQIAALTAERDEARKEADREHRISAQALLDSESFRRDAEASRALLAEAAEGLKRCQRTLAMMIDPNTIAGTSTQHAWAQCVEAEAALRELVTKLRSA